MSRASASQIDEVERAIVALRDGEKLEDVAQRIVGVDQDATRADVRDTRSDETRVDGGNSRPQPDELCDLALHDEIDRAELMDALESWLHAQRGARRNAAARDLFQLALDEAAASAHVDDARYIDGDEIGAGGMGRIESVFDTKLQREVARKVVTDAHSRAARSRFLREARLTSQLEHPNIVPVYDVNDETAREPSFTMRLVRGRSLAELVRKHEAGSLVARLDIFRKVCDAIAYAHSRGVIHRDIKPANVMVGEFGEVLVMDWGLAKALDEGVVSSRIPAGDPLNDGNLTMVGTIAGTPQYMAPEQARGELHSASTRTDVYALGALLYFLVTEGPPFRGASDQVLELVKNGKLEPPRRRASGKDVPRELDAVVMKAMALDADDRYASVIALRDDVQAFLEGQPLGAMQYNPWDLLKKWAGRHRRSLRGAALAGLLFTVVLMGLAVRYLAAIRAARDEAVAEATRARAAERESILRSAEGFVAIAYADAEADRIYAAYHALDQASELYAQVGDDATRARLAYALFDATNVSPLRSWSTKQATTGACMSADGDEAITVGRAGGAVLWALPTGRELARIDPSPHSPISGRGCVIADGLRLVVQRQPKGLAVRDVQSGRLLQRISVDHEGQWYSVLAPRAPRAFVVTRADRTVVSVWDLRTGARVDAGIDQHARMLTTSHDGQRLAVTLGSLNESPSKRDTAVVDVASGNIVQRFPPADRVAFSPDGSRLLCLDLQSELVMYSMADGAELWRQPGHKVTQIQVTDDHVFAKDLAHNVDLLRGGDGKHLATYRGTDHSNATTVPDVDRWVLETNGDGVARLLPVVARPPADADTLHSDMVLSVALSADGQLAVTGCEDGSVRLWDVPTRRLLRELVAPDSRIRGVDFSPDGTRVVAAGMEGGTRIWSLDSGRVAQRIAAKDGEMATAARFVDDEHVVISHSSGALGMWRIGDDKPMRQFKGHNGFIWQLAVSPDGKRIASTGRAEVDQTVRIWQVESGKNWKLLKQPTVTYRASFSPDGSKLAVGRHDRMALQWPLLGDGKPSMAGSLDGPAMGVAYSPDGKLLAVTDYVGKLRFYAADSNEQLGRWSIHRAPAAELAFSRDGRWLASSGDDGRVVFIDLQHRAHHRRLDEALASGWKDDAASWLALGELGLLSGAWSTARKALNRAQALGARPDRFSLARAQWADGKPTAALKTLGQDASGVSPQTLAIWRAALKAQQRRDDRDQL